MSVEFTPWPKTARLFRDIVITEKIDGTNAAIHVEEDGTVTAQSRKRLITPDADNFGFARWVHDNASELASILGTGLHFGEWWGRGIQRGYTLPGRVFSLFNTERWFRVSPEDPHGLDSMATRAEMSSLAGQIRAVPVLYQGIFRESEITAWLSALRKTGSVAAPGFDNPEGICVYHTQTRSVFKVTLDNDAGKWEGTK